MMPGSRGKSLSVIAFGIAFGCVEAAVVVYLRALYYPSGFTFPLSPMVHGHVVVELLRECATILMLGVVGVLSGKDRWSRFAYAIIAFGVWDIFYYLWLRLFIQWPASLLDWDVLFLVPVPWVGPVYAPLIISLLMIVSGLLIADRRERSVEFRPPWKAWCAGVVGVAVILWTFIVDAASAFDGVTPAPFRAGEFSGGVALVIVAFAVSWWSKKS